MCSLSNENNRDYQFPFQVLERNILSTQGQWAHTVIIPYKPEPQRAHFPDLIWPGMYLSGKFISSLRAMPSEVNRSAGHTQHVQESKPPTIYWLLRETSF